MYTCCGTYINIIIYKYVGVSIYFFGYYHNVNATIARRGGGVFFFFCCKCISKQTVFESFSIYNIIYTVLLLPKLNIAVLLCNILTHINL